MPPLSQRAIEGAELIVAHGAPHLVDAAARQEKEAVIDKLHGGIRELIGHGAQDLPCGWSRQPPQTWAV